MSLSKINPQDKEEEKQTIDLIYIAPEERWNHSIEKSIFFHQKEHTLEELAEIFKIHVSESENQKTNMHKISGVILAGMGERSSVLHYREHERHLRVNELIDILDSIEARPGKGVVFVHEGNVNEVRGTVNLADFESMLLGEIRADFMITKQRIEDYDIAVNLEKETPTYNKYAKNFHKFHSKKPRGPKGQYGNNRRK